MKKKNITNGKTRIDVKSILYFGVNMNERLRQIVQIRLDNQHGAHKSCCDAHLIRDKFDDTLSCILLLKYKLLYQLVPKLKSLRIYFALHQDSTPDCDDRRKDPDQRLNDKPLNFHNLIVSLPKCKQGGTCEATEHDLGA